MEEYRVLSIESFTNIRDSEVEILRLLRREHNYIHDYRGDIRYDIDGNPIIDLNNVPIKGVLCVPDRNMFSHLINGKNISDLVSTDVINGYNDVFGIDSTFLSGDYRDYSISVLGYFVDSVYQGCVWFFTHRQYTQYIGLYGIRSSIVNTLSGVRGIARKIVTYFVDNRITGVDTIIVPWPLSPMHILLGKMGFTRHDVLYRDDTLTDEQKFLSAIATTSEFYTFSM